MTEQLHQPDDPTPTTAQLRAEATQMDGYADKPGLDEQLRRLYDGQARLLTAAADKLAQLEDRTAK